MNGKPAWWRWFSTRLGINTAIVLFNAILIGILWNAVFGIVQTERQDTIRAAIDRNDNLAIAFEQYTIRTIENADAVIQHLIGEYAQYGGKIDLTKWAAAHTIDNKTIIGVVLADEHGNALTTAYSPNQAEQMNVADREHFRVHIERDSGRLFVGKPVVGRVTGQGVIPVTRRINKADGTFGGVAMALIEPARFTDVLRDARLLPLDVISLVGLDGITRARLKGTTASWGEDISKSPLLAEQARHPNGNYFAIGQLDNVPRFFSYRSLPAYQVMVIVGTAEADVMAEFYRRQARYFWVAGLTSAVIAGFAILLMLALASQRRAAAAVVRSQARILATFDQAAVGIAHTDLEGRYLEVNQKLCDILGYSREELLKRRFNDVTHPDDVHSIADSRRLLLTNPQEITSLEREKRYIRKDGAIIWCSVTLSVVHDNKGQVEYVLAMIQDISDRKRAEEELRESQARFGILTGMSTDFYWESDTDHRLTARASANKNVSMVSAFQRGAQIGERRWEIPHLSPDEAGWQAHRAVLDAHLPFRNFELSRLGADGAERHISISGDPVFDASGAFKGYRGIGTDITERKQGERLVRESEKRFRAIFDQAPVAMALLDKEGHPVISNAYLLKMIGYSNDELSKMKFSEFTYPEDVDKDLIQFTKLMDGEISSYRMEKRFVHKNGSVLWANLLVTVLRDENGLSQDIIGMTEDITERKRTEQELRESERRFSDMLGNVQLVSIMLDREARITYCNDYLLSLTGWRSEEVIGRNWFDLFIPPELTALRRPFFAALLANQPDVWHHENEILTRSGERRLIRWNNSVLRSGAGDVTGIAGIGEDITGQKRAEIRINRLNRVYAVLSGINALIVRVHDRREVFNEACRIAVEHGHFGLAWIGMFDPATQDVTPVAWAGESTGEMTTVKSSSRDDTPAGKGAVGRAIRERRPVFNNDILAHGTGGPRMKEVLKLGFRSQLTLPLFENEAVVGTLTMYAKEPNFFDEDELRLLTELGGNISFALGNISRQQKLDKLARIRAVSSEINAAIVRIHDRKALFEETCRIASEHGKFEMIWIGMVDVVKQEIQAVAWAGFSPEIANTVSWKSMTAARGTLSEAILTRKPAVRNDIETTPTAGPMRGEALARGCGSTASLPLVVNDKVAAIIVLFAPGTGFFDEEELALLNEVAANISFALEHIEKEEKIAGLSRIRAVLGRIDALIVRARDRDELFREACQIAVEEGQLRMALIAIEDRNEMKIVPVASAGKDEELLTAIKDVLSSTEGAPTTMVARAMREKKAVVSNDSQNDPQVLFNKKYADSGVRSMAVLPLIVSDEAMGVLALYSEETGFFDEEELKLLAELCGDIAFAIDHIDKQARLDYLAYYDALTGLANRNLFLERVAQYMRSAVTGGHKLALFLFDLERFKSINDSLGRPAGDALLKQVAEWLTRNAGDANLFARIDADHFAIVMPEVRSGGDLSRLVEKMSAAFLEHPFRLNDAVFRIAVKVGAALFPDDGGDADTLFRNAEAALKKAKASGERYLFYTQKMTEAVAGKLTMENQLRQAIDNEEFVLHYQPKVNLASGKMTSAEALIRWNDPRTGLVPPGRFIPVLEETGLIYEVGRWALRKAIEDYLRWRAAGLPAVRIAVNVSPLQLRNRGFVDEIKHVIGIDAHAPAGLELEITESLIMEDVKHNISSLQAIRAMDVTIAIDDFGTGFSSLSYLARLPVDTLKIDRSFVIAMTADPEGLALVSTIINLAHSLKLKVVAEGVETEEQSRLLRLLSCDEMQGFLFSKPVPAEVFETRFLARTIAV